jgi:hypothetical protein
MLFKSPKDSVQIKKLPSKPKNMIPLSHYAGVALSMRQA